MKNQHEEMLHQQFQNLFDEYEAEPSPAVWMKVEAELAPKSANWLKAFPLANWSYPQFGMMGASAIALLVAFWWFFAQPVPQVAPSLAQNTPSQNAPSQNTPSQNAPSAILPKPVLPVNPAPALTSPNLAEATSRNVTSRNVASRNEASHNLTPRTLTSRNEIPSRTTTNHETDTAPTTAATLPASAPVNALSVASDVPLATDMLPPLLPMDHPSEAGKRTISPVPNTENRYVRVPKVQIGDTETMQNWAFSIGATPSLTYQSMTPQTAKGNAINTADKAAAQNIQSPSTFSQDRFGSQFHLSLGRNITKHLFIESNGVYFVQPQNLNYEVQTNAFDIVRTSDNTFDVQRITQSYSTHQNQQFMGLQMALGLQKIKSKQERFAKFGGEMLWQLDTQKRIPSVLGSLGLTQNMRVVFLRAEVQLRYQLSAQNDPLGLVKVQPYQTGLRLSIGKKF
jgi:cytoskeletal protein RodZ